MAAVVTANLPTNIVDFTGFDSSIMLNLRGGIPRPKGKFPETLNQAMLVGIMLVGRLGVVAWGKSCTSKRWTSIGDFKDTVFVVSYTSC